jgi:hypothetical protein
MPENASVTGVKGLDMGTSRIVIARQEGDQTHFESQLNAFVSLAYSRVTAKMLEREGIMHLVDRSEILAYGNRVEEFANILQGNTRRPMRTGILNPREPKSLQMIELALTSLCGKANPGEKICFSVPSEPAGHESDLIYHERTLTQMLEKLGYQVMSLNEGLAVVYAELEDTNFTGIGVSFGGGMCNVCLAYLGLPAVKFSTVRAGDYIDESAASVSGETITTARFYKENKFSMNGLSSQNIDQALTVYYHDVIKTAVDRLQQAFSETKKLPKFDKPVPMAVAGGSTKPEGFHEALEKALHSANLPIEISEVRASRDPFNATARGALMAAMLDS